MSLARLKTGGARAVHPPQQRVGRRLQQAIKAYTNQLIKNRTATI